MIPHLLPSPSMGEGEGGGEDRNLPLPLAPPTKGGEIIRNFSL